MLDHFLYAKEHARFLFRDNLAPLVSSEDLRVLSRSNELHVSAFDIHLVDLCVEHGLTELIDGQVTIELVLAETVLPGEVRIDLDAIVNDV